MQIFPLDSLDVESILACAVQMFPLDSLDEVNGIDVRGWTIERVAPLLEVVLLTSPATLESN